MNGVNPMGFSPNRKEVREGWDVTFTHIGKSR